MREETAMVREETATVRGAAVTRAQMEQAGFSVEDVGEVLAGLKEDGLTVHEAKDAGYTASQMLAAGYDHSTHASEEQHEGHDHSLQDLKAGGTTTKQAAAAGFSPEQMEKAGYTPDEIADIAGGMTAQEATDAGFDFRSCLCGFPLAMTLGVLRNICEVPFP